MESRARQRYEESREDAARFAETKPPSRPGTRYESRMPRLENIGEQLRSPRDVRKPSPDLPARTPSTQLALNFGFSPVVRSGAQVPPLSQSVDSSRLSGASLGRRSSSDVPILGVAPPRSERLLKLDAVCLVESLRHGKSSMLEELIELLGEEAAVKHVAAYGGTRLYVPHDPEADDALVSSIGLSAAIRLARVYGGDRVDVPNPTPRRTRILQLRARGLSVDAIARSLQCTRRRVFQVLAEARAAKRAV